MKKLFILSSLFCAVLAQAAVVLTEPFNYPNGSLISQEPGWTAHSGAGSGPQTVTNQSLRVVFGNAEDDSVLLPNSPYNGTANGNPLVSSLYASMVLNFESLPGSTNTVNNNYFAHFKDTSTGLAQTNGFRCRLFAYTNGAPDGQLLLGLTAVGGTVTNADYVVNNTPLSTNTAYTVVMRVGINDGNSQMWINPNQEADPSVSAAGPGNAVDMSYFAFRQEGNSFPGIVRVSDLKIGTSFSDVAGTNTPPAVGGIPSRIDTPRNVAVTIPFTVSDDHNPASVITTTATSGNTVLVPNANLVITNSPDGTSRGLTITPANNRETNALITLVAKNPGGASNVITFRVFVGAPSISAIPAQLAFAGDPASVVHFQVQDHESAATSLSVTATSSNPTLVANTSAALSLTSDSSGTNRTLTITPQSGQTGLTTITVKCSDAFNTVTNTFIYDVAPQLGIQLADNFDGYPDGTALVADDINWYRLSGTLYQCVVSNQMAVINEANSEDVYASLTNAPFSTSSGAVLYYGFKLNVAKLPSAAGDYFMLLNDTSSSGFKAKTFVSSAQSAAGYYRVGIANGGSAPNVSFPQDLSPNSSYYVVVRYIVGSGSTTLWVNPIAETSSNVTALDGTPPQEIDQIVLRESVPGEGIEYIDNLVVSTSFADVAPALIVNPIANHTTPVSTSTGPIPFVVTDKAVSPDTCTYTGASDNQSVVSDAKISFGGSGTNRTITILPNLGQQGFANITVNVSDSAGNANTTTFLLTVGNPATNGIVISQIYPGGGNTGATYSQKFVELFNHTANPVSLNNWSLQYASSTGSTWTAGNFANVLVPPYSYYLVAIGSVGTNGVALPVTPDYALAVINPSQSAGKLALCNSQAPLTGASPLSNATLSDFVGYGTGTTAYEGSGPVNWTTANANAMFRASGGCIDTGNNAADFTSATASPRNSATSQNMCVSSAPTMRAFISGNNIVLAWPSSTIGFNLETAATVNQNPWNAVGTTPTVVGSEYQVSVPITGAAYYRLKH